MYCKQHALKRTGEESIGTIIIGDYQIMGKVSGRQDRKQRGVLFCLLVGFFFLLSFCFYFLFLKSVKV